jgi:Uma2 family endonuclease
MPLLAEPALLRHRSVPQSPVAPPADMDQRVILYGMTWKDYELMLAIRGDRAGARMAYLNGAIELMSPSINHEGVKTTLARLVEAYAEEREIDLNGYGSWTLKNAFLERGLEPDECYVIGPARSEVPELAIEVVWTSGGLNKLEIYRALGVGEVWIWERGAGIKVHLLREGHYQQAEKSALLPDLDLSLLDRFAMSPNQSQAVREFRALVRAPQKKARSVPVGRRRAGAKKK